MDEKDIIEQNEALTGQNAKLTADLEALQTQVAELTSTKTTLAEEFDAFKAQAKTETEQANANIETMKASLAEVTKERDALKAKTEELTASQADFDAAVAKKVADLGITSEAVTQENPNHEKKMSLTERARAAKQAQ